MIKGREMKKLLISISVLVVFIVGGCATSSSPKPEASLNQQTTVKFPSDAAEYQKSCDLNNAEGCKKLGDLYRYGKGVKKDKLQEKKYYHKACDLKNGTGCTALGIYYGEAISPEKDRVKSSKYYRKGCDLNEPAGCFYLAIYYLNGEGVKKDPHKAKNLFKKACDLNFSMGCQFYSSLKSQGY